VERLSYGSDPHQFGELSLPQTGEEHPVAVVIHGGFWRAKYNLEYIRPLCDALVQAGIATWSLEYRRLGNPGGGWPGTFDDISAGVAYLTSIAPMSHLDLDRVITIGHSAGGHLALWVSGRNKLIAGAISLAGVVDLRRAWELQLSNTVVADLLGGGPEEVPERYDFASPIEQLPIGIPQRLFHGTADANIPLEISDRYVHTAQLRGDEARLITLEGANHFDVVDPRTKEFALVRESAIDLLR
jgi:dipeptidyl aminopeptidase/acylaminoacyl peptidase